MNVMTVPFELPSTETAAWVRPVMKYKTDERAAVSSDPPMLVAANFLRSLVGSEVPSAVAEQAIVILERVRAQLRSVGIPTIAPAPDGLVGMTWESAREHVNVQVLPDRRVEYFAEDLNTGALWSDESDWGTLSPELIAKLQRVR